MGNEITKYRVVRSGSYNEWLLALLGVPPLIVAVGIMIYPTGITQPLVKVAVADFLLFATVLSWTSVRSLVVEVDGRLVSVPAWTLLVRVLMALCICVPVGLIAAIYIAATR